MGLFSTVAYILRHPLNANHKMAALQRFIRWQIGSRLLPGSVAVPFAGGTRLLVQRRMTGATGNLYCGLHEFEDMAFLLHLLRPGDLFLDVGANVGSYTVLAAGACGASVVALEPIPATFAHFLDNVRLNDVQELVTAINAGLGAEEGELHFSNGPVDTVNHVLGPEEARGTGGVRVQVHTMDGLLAGRCPVLIKIDVEGYEASVLQGARRTLEGDGVVALILELNGSGARYGFDEERVHADIVGRGFAPHRYDPFSRELTVLPSRNLTSGNTLYIRDIDAARQRTVSAPRRPVHGITL